LKAGVNYYFEAWHENLADKGHITVGAEVKPDSNTHSYNKVSKQWMDIKISQSSASGS